MRFVPRLVVFAVPLIAAAGVVAALVLHARISASLGDSPELYIADVWVALVFPVVGAWLITRGQYDRLARVLLGSGCLAIVALGVGWAAHDGLDGQLHLAGNVAAWLASWMWTPYLLLLTLTPVLYVDPALRGGATRVLAWTTLVVVAFATAAAAVSPGPISEASSVVNPLGVTGAGWLTGVVMGAAGLTQLVLAPACVVASGVYLRRARLRDRSGGSVVATAALAWIGVMASDGAAYPWNDVATAVAMSLPVLAVVVAVREGQIRRDARREGAQLRAAREVERRRLRRELHDGLGPELAGLRLRLAASAADAPESLQAELDAATGRLATLAGDVRRLVDGLRPTALDDLGLAEAVRTRSALLDAGDTDVHCQVGRVPTCDAAVELAAYQIASEALANAVRHAGARRIDVRLAETVEGGLLVEVRDDGRGGATDRNEGVGLGSMRSRAEQVGGRLSVTSTSHGTMVRACLPAGVSA